MVKRELKNSEGQKALRNKVKKLAGMLMIIAVTTLTAMLIRRMGFHESNIIMLYLLGVLMVSFTLEGFTYGIIASFLSVLTFNFFFTVPYYSLLAYRQDYPVTFLMMLLASMLMSTLTNKVKQEAKLSKIREKRTFVLYRMSQGLLKAQNAEEICKVVGEEVSDVLNIVVSIRLNLIHSSGSALYEKGERVQRTIRQSNEQLVMEQYVMDTSIASRFNKDSDSDFDFYYAPIKGPSGTMGVLGVSLKPNEILYREKLTLIQGMTYQIGLALERVLIARAKQEQHMIIESERFKGNLLRAISHDLRTPLTGILGASTTILDHNLEISEDQKQSLIKDIAEDAQWLIQSVENILSMTRIDEGRIKLNIQSELIDDLILESLNRFKSKEHLNEIQVKLPTELVAVEVDGTLIKQVLINLIDNAIKYTPVNSKIYIEVNSYSDHVVFKVEDEGKGIEPEHIPLIFNRFFRAELTSDRGKNGIGLGLEICKSIVEAHRGEIQVYNNEKGGATFEFSLPKESI